MFVPYFKRGVVHIMRITSLHIENFKSIESLTIQEIEQAMILVGKNNTGKTVVLDALLVLSGQLPIKKEHFNNIKKKIVISGTLEITEEDLKQLHDKGLVSKYKNFDKWKELIKGKEITPNLTHITT